MCLPPVTFVSVLLPFVTKLVVPVCWVGKKTIKKNGKWDEKNNDKKETASQHLCRVVRVK